MTLRTSLSAWRFPGGAEGPALLSVVLLMGLSWYLISGVATAVYEQYEVFGDAPLALGSTYGHPADQLGHNAYFWSERAFHYRTTLMFALEHGGSFDDTATLKKDTWQQYPDGVNAWAEYTLLMEPVYGQLYRWFARPDQSLVDFLLLLIPLVHVLLFLPLYWLARGVGARPWVSLGAVLVYATATMGFTRLTGSLLLKEDFALPWLMLFLAAHVWSCRRRDFRILLVAAVALVVALASWHLSQFLVLVVFLASGLADALGTEQDPKELVTKPRGFWPGRWWPPAVYGLAGLLAWFTPSLWSRGFIMSWPMAALGAWLLSARWGVSNRPGPGAMVRSRLGLWLGSLILLGLLVVFNPLVHGDYNHVTGLLVQKIAHGFSRPADPSRLPFAVRIFWAPPFTSPDWAQVQARLGFHFWLFLVSAIWLAVLAFRRRFDRFQSAFLLVVLGYLVAWLMVERLGVVFWPVAAVAVALAVESNAHRKGGGGKKVFLPLGLGLMVLSSTLNVMGPLDPQWKMARRTKSGLPVRVEAKDMQTAPFKVELFDWLRRQTPGPGSPFSRQPAGGVLGEIGVSPQVLLYARRPIILNSQFENTPIRRRYQHYLELVFGTDEKAFQKFLREVDAAYVFINRNWATSDGVGSMAWQAGVSGRITSRMLITRLHFKPNSFSFLRPVFDNEYYRVFRVGTDTSAAGPEVTWQSKHDPWWDEDNFPMSQDGIEDLAADKQNILAAENKWHEIQNRLGAILATGVNPPLMALHQQRMQLALDKLSGETAPIQQKDALLARKIHDRLDLVHPVEGRPLGMLLDSLLRGGKGHEGALALLANKPAGPLHHAITGQLWGLLDHYDQAAAELEKAASFFPLAPLRQGWDGRPRPRASVMASRLRQECVWWTLGAGRLARAKTLAGQFLPFEKAGSRQADFYERILAAGVE